MDSLAQGTFARGTAKDSFLTKLKRGKSSYLFMLPFMVTFFVFMVVPVVTVVILSFTNFNMVTAPTFAGLSNYIRLFLNDDVFLISIKNTMIFAFVTGPVSYVICLLLAWLVNEVRKELRVFFTVIYYAPSLTGSAVLIWVYIFSGDSYGLVNSLLMRLGIISDPVKWLIDPQYNFIILMLIQVWLSLGTGFLAFIAGLLSIDKSIYEAGAIDGVKNRFQELWYVTLPSMRPQLMFGAVMQISASFAVSAVPMALTGFPSTNYSTNTVITHILDTGTIRMEMGYACSIATILFFVMVLTRNLVSLVVKSD